MGSPKGECQKLFKVFLVAWHVIQLLEIVHSQELLPKPEAIKIVVKHEDLILPKILTKPPSEPPTITETETSYSTTSNSLNYSPTTLRDVIKRRQKVQSKSQIEKISRPTLSRFPTYPSTTTKTSVPKKDRKRFRPQKPPNLEEKATVVEITDQTEQAENTTQVHLVYPINSNDYLSTVPDSLPGMNFAQLQDYKSRQQYPSSTIQTTKTTILSTISGYLDESTLSENIISTTERSTSRDTTQDLISDEDPTNREILEEVNPTTESGSETGNRFTTRTNPGRPKPHLLQHLEPTPPTTNFGLKISSTEAEPTGIESKSFETRTFTATFRPSTAIAKTSRPSYHITSTFRPTVLPSSRSRSHPSQVPTLIEDTAIFDPALSELEEFGFQSERIHKDDLVELDTDSDESEIFPPITGTPITTTITSNKSVLMSSSRASTDNREDESDNNDEGMRHQNDDDLVGFKRHETNRKLGPKSSEENDQSREKEDDDDNHDDMEELIRDWGESIIRSVKANNQANNSESTSKASRQPIRHRYKVNSQNLDLASTENDSILTEQSNRLVRQLPPIVPPTDFIQRAFPSQYGTPEHTKYKRPQYETSTPKVISSTVFNGHGIVPTIGPDPIRSKWQGPTIPPLRRNHFNAHNYFDSSTPDSESKVSVSNFLTDDMDQSSQDSITKYTYKYLPRSQSHSKSTVTESPLVSITAQSNRSPDGLFHPEQATPLPKHSNGTLSNSNFGSKFQRGISEKTTPLVTTFRPEFTNEYQDLRYMSNQERSEPNKPSPSPTPSTFQIVNDFPKVSRGSTINLFRHPTNFPSLVSESIPSRTSYKTTQLPLRELTLPVVKQLPSTTATLTRSPPRPDLQTLPGLRPDPKNHQPPYPVSKPFVLKGSPSSITDKTEQIAPGEDEEDSVAAASFEVTNKIKELKSIANKEDKRESPSYDEIRPKRKPFFPRRRYSRPNSPRSKEQKLSVGASVVTRAPDGYKIESPNLYLEVDFPANGDREATISRNDIRRFNPKRGRQRLSTLKPKTPNPTIDKLRDFSIPNFDRFETSLKEREHKINPVEFNSKQDSKDKKTDQVPPTKPTKFSFERQKFKALDEERFKKELREIPNIVPTDWSKPFSSEKEVKVDSTTSRIYTVPHRKSVKEFNRFDSKPLSKDSKEDSSKKEPYVNRFHSRRNFTHSKPRDRNSFNINAYPKTTEIPKFTYKILEPPSKPTQLPQFTYTLLDPEKIQSSKPTHPTIFDQFNDFAKDVDDDDNEDDYILVRDPGQRGFIEIKKEEIGSGLASNNPFTRSKTKTSNQEFRTPDAEPQKFPPFLNPDPTIKYKDASFPSFFAVPSGSDSERQTPKTKDTFPSALEPQPSVHTYTKVNSPPPNVHAFNKVNSPQPREVSSNLNQNHNSNQVLEENTRLEAKTRYEPIDITDVEGPPKVLKSSKTYKKYIPPSKSLTSKPSIKAPINNLPTFTLPSMTPNILKLNSQFRNQPKHIPSQQPKIQPRPGLRTTESTLDFPSDMPNPFRTEIGSSFEFLNVPSSLPRPASTAELQTIEYATRPTVLKLQPQPPTEAVGSQVNKPRPSSSQVYIPPKVYRQPVPSISNIALTTPLPQINHVTSRSDSGDDLEYEYTGMGTDPLPKVLLANGLTVMAALISEAGMEVRLSGPGPYTVFAPSDKAFNEFLNDYHEGGVSSALEALKANKAELIRIVQNHVVKGLVLGRDLEDDLVGTSLSGSKLRSNLYLTESQDWKEILVKTINGGIVQKTDVEASNGVIHLIDRVLFPPATQNIIQTLKSDPEGRFTTLLKALKATKLDQEISDFSTGPWTIFAPTNEAFMNLPMTELEDLIQDPKKLHRLVLNHLINRSVFSAGLKPHQVIDMANGNKLNLFSRRDRVKIDGANISDMDIPAANGVIQIVENVIELKDDAQSSLESLERTIKPSLLKPPKTPKLFRF